MLDLGKFDAIVIPNFSFPPNPNFYYFYRRFEHGILVFDGRFKFYTTKFDYHGHGKIIDGYVKFVKSLGRVGIDKKHWPFKPLGTDIGKKLEKMREIKTEKEVQNIKRMCRETEKIFKKVSKKIVGMTEIEASSYIIYEIGRRGFYPSFVPIVSTEPHVHHINSRKVIRKDDTILVDMGIWNGYSSDMTRMINPPAELEKVVRDVFNYAYEKIKPGVKISEFCKEARRKMGRYANYFPHALGHGVGIAVHELPHVSVRSKEKFRDGMVFTIEPGIYTKKKFIRIEDVFVLRRDGIEKL